MSFDEYECMQAHIRNLESKLDTSRTSFEALVKSSQSVRQTLGKQVQKLQEEVTALKDAKQGRERGQQGPGRLSPLHEANPTSPGARKQRSASATATSAASSEAKEGTHAPHVYYSPVGDLKESGS